MALPEDPEELEQCSDGTWELPAQQHSTQPWRNSRGGFTPSRLVLHHRARRMRSTRQRCSSSPGTSPAQPAAALPPGFIQRRGNTVLPQRCTKAQGHSRVQQAVRHLTPARGREPLPAVRANGRGGQERVLAAAPGRAELPGWPACWRAARGAGGSVQPSGPWACRHPHRLHAGSPEANGCRPLR